MNQTRKLAARLLASAVVTALLLTFGPGSPGTKLGIAINYTYRMVLPEVASDGVP